MVLLQGPTRGSDWSSPRVGPDRDGLLYHGGRDHTFVCWAGAKNLETIFGTQIMVWNQQRETLGKPEEFCACCKKVGTAGRPGVTRYRCLGHKNVEDPGPQAGAPSKRSEEGVR